MHDGVYWINIDYVFKGDRLTLVNQYILDGATEVDPKTYDAITLRRTRMPQKERPRKTGTGTPVTFPTKFSERMRAAMFPRQNLKRREAAFLLGATAFRTREMQKCASPFVEVRKLSFSQEKLLTAHYHEPTHTPSMDMRERSGSHLRSVATREASAASL